MKWIRMTSQIIAMVGGLILLVLLMSQSGWRALNVATGSMSPAIKPSSLVIIHKVPQSKLKVGDVVTYMAPAGNGQTITHRIVKVEERHGARWITTKGDANEVADRPFAAGRVVGRVLIAAPGLGGLAQSLRTPGLALAVVILPASWVIIAEMRTLWRIWRGPSLAGGLTQLGVMALAATVIFSISSTRAELRDQVGMTGNTIRVVAPAPSVTPSPSPTPSMTASPALKPNDAANLRRDGEKSPSR